MSENNCFHFINIKSASSERPTLEDESKSQKPQTEFVELAEGVAPAISADVIKEHLSEELKSCKRPNSKLELVQLVDQYVQGQDKVTFHYSFLKNIDS